jgi:hypothetical protein
MGDRTMTVAAELRALRSADGMIHVSTAVDWAATHPGSALHRSLEWNDAVAGTKYREWQVRQLIAVYVRDDDGNRQMISLKLDRVADGGYRDIADVMEAPDMRAAALRDALDEYNRIKDKYDWLVELAEIHAAIERVERPARRRRRITEERPRPAA